MGSFDCIVVGGGLVGSAIAYGLAGRGLKTAMLDEGDVALRASRGNFGLVWVQCKGKGRPEYARWSRLSSEVWPDFAAELKDLTGIGVGYSKPGGVLVALTDAELESYVTLLQELRRDAGNDGYEYEVLDQPGLAKLLPGLGPTVAGGTYCPYDGHANPLLLMRGLHAGFQARGGRYFPNRPVSAIESGDGGFRVGVGNQAFEAGKVVLAAGLGNRDLGRLIALNVPVEPLFGQLMVTERVRPRFEIPTNLLRQTVEGSLMLGYSQEDRGFRTDTRPETMRDIAFRCATAFPFLAGLRIIRTWGALRVMPPDGFPIYEQSERFPGAFVVTSHSGVTLAANHAVHLAGWIAEGELPPDLDCYRSRRFDVQTPT